MDVIPVIDVRQGIAVRAMRGCRTDYQPLKTSLSESNKPEAVALGFRSLYPFPILYLADLDGIEGCGRDVALPKKLLEVLPDMELWIDNGSTPRDFAARIGDETNTTTVIGSESLVEADAVILRSMDADSYVLSLDFKDDHFLGPASVLEDAEHWPERVIAMTLGRVGGNEGPDLDRVAEFVARAAGRRIYAAGGVRDRYDVNGLRAAGAAGVLVATALHSERITASDLNEIASR